uniref:F-box domain-containing protein n=1 Tax=Nelumbo nucifera TaxID=4432 RepID=A0A822YXT5_NELNU|nr:TPA_asm: hypothetical protein HUJ06_006625 [Nelumbo nucifera]
MEFGEQDELQVEKKRLSDMGNVGEGCDRISDLPESILHHILSFLPARYAVRTSILSRRWQHLWYYVSILDFDDDLLSDDGINEDLKCKYMDFVDKVLVLHSSLNLYRVRLPCGDCDASRVDTWIRAAINREVKELSLFISPTVEFTLPCCLFTCESLEVLTLHLDDSVLYLPTSIFLPGLKIVNLMSVIFLDGKSADEFFSNCPALESLVMMCCDIMTSGFLHISAPKLKSLSICGGHNGLIHSKIKVSTPSLVSIKYDCYTAQDYLVENTPNLIDACIKLQANFGQNTVNSVHGYLANKFLRQLFMVEVLKLSDSSIEIISRVHDLFDHLPTFNNLKRLILTTGYCKIHLMAVTFLFQRSPKLEYLQIKIDHCLHVYDDQERWESNSLDLLCPLDHLKTVEIKCFEGRDNELELVKFFLKNAEVLKQITVVATPNLSEDLGKQMEISRMLITFPRASRTTLVDFKILERGVHYDQASVLSREGTWEPFLFTRRKRPLKFVEWARMRMRRPDDTVLASQYEEDRLEDEDGKPDNDYLLEDEVDMLENEEDWFEDEYNMPDDDNGFLEDEVEMPGDQDDMPENEEVLLEEEYNMPDNVNGLLEDEVQIPGYMEAMPENEVDLLKNEYSMPDDNNGLLEMPVDQEAMPENEENFFFGSMEMKRT